MISFIVLSMHLMWSVLPFVMFSLLLTESCSSASDLFSCRSHMIIRIVKEKFVVYVTRWCKDVGLAVKTLWIQQVAVV